MPQHPIRLFSGNNVLYISSFEDGLVRVHVPSLTEFPEKSYPLSAGGSTIVKLSGGVRTNCNSGSEIKKGIRITAAKPISVQGLVDATPDVEGFLGLPVDALGTFYIAATYHPVINAIIQVVATTDDTNVTITLRTKGRVQYEDKWYGNGAVLSENLNYLDVFQILADQDLTGTIIRSTKPIAVFTGNDCTMVPENQLPCNHLVEQIPPVSLWGKVFVTNPTPWGDEFHVVAANQNTAVFVDSQNKGSLNEGEKYKIDASWEKSLVISTSQPSLVMQYSKTGNSPSMNVVPPVQWFTNDYTVHVSQDGQGNTFNCSVNIIIDTSLRSDLRVKDADSVIKNWIAIPGSGGFSSASIQLTSNGTYHVYHVNSLTTFSAVFYGTNRNGRLFAMPAGMKMQRQAVNNSCIQTNTVGGDNIDNDCDGVTDEELKNYVDDDQDGRVDEDLVTPVPTITTPKDYVTTLCHRSSSVSNLENATGSAHGVCRIRGGTKIGHKDSIVRNDACGRIFDRVWILRDSCDNTVTGIQRITIHNPEDPKIIFPKDIVFTCREKKYLDPKFVGQVSVSSVTNVCPRNVTITYLDRNKGDCSNSNREGRLERIWTVKDKCKGSQTRKQVIILLPKEFRRTTNYVVSFKITNEMFSAELRDMESASFKSLSRGLEIELETTFIQSKSILGELFVAATVLDFNNGSVIPRLLIKIDAQAQISQRQLVDFMNETLRSGMLGKYHVDPTSLESTDFDECQASNLNECHEYAKCTNTLGSYNCSCLKGFVGNGVLCQAPPSINYVDPAIEIGTEENVTLACHAEGLPEPTITWVTPDEQVVTAANETLETTTLDDGSKFVRGKKMLQDGSLLIYNTRDNDDGIYKCIAKNVVGTDEKSVNVTVRDDLVGVDAAITIEDEIFDQDLENKSSTRYQTLEQQVKQELTTLFQDIEGFEEVIILGFVNGSVKVEFRVVVTVKPEEKKSTVIANKVGKTLIAGVQSGQIGSFKVKKKVELRERPPPPKDVQASNVEQTEAVITWSHPELYQMYSISGYSLQIRKFRTEKWIHFTSTPGENHRITNLDPDTAYFVRLKSENEYGMGEPSVNGELKTEKGKNVAKLALAIVIPLVLTIILLIVAVSIYRRLKKKGQGTGFLNDGEQVPMNPVSPDTQNHSEAENGRFTTSTFGRDRYALVPGQAPNNAAAPIDIEASFAWREIPRDRITLGKVLGEGEFGMVVRGELTEDDGNVITCAVKKLKRTATESDLKDLLNELEIMTSVGEHPNLVNLIGACSASGPLLIVVEFAEHGNLLRHLRDHRKENYEDMNEYSLEISSAERLRIASDVSSGMKHLAAMKCAHRDLAARNILLGEGMVAKVSDFGLSRDIYTDNVYAKTTGGKLPAKWMAIESLEQGLYTSQSDVWSFGVLLWEIETGGCAPYAGIASGELLPKLKAGHRLEKPRYCTDWLYAMMLRCWNANPKARPGFGDLSDELHRILQQESEYLTPEDYREDSSYVNT
ncbi:Fibroblast growth factor receptor 1 [Stylophora pistillata]|uniref:receptor protein-tyrosine kinase n=2 Tax=Stylophora pistillata TaxID=50429 RepID=A0A2B4RVN9_STYPI|nr:Fibroblast growth factor receptor 1 [Stylophora pistillata]